MFPNSVGKVTRYGAFLEGVWTPLLIAAKLPYRKPHAMRHSYATWMLALVLVPSYAEAECAWVLWEGFTPGDRWNALGGWSDLKKESKPWQSASELWVVDESSMISTEQARAVVSAADRQKATSMI